MEHVESWGEAITLSLINVGQGVIDFLPLVIGALLVLIAGWIISSTIGRLVEKALRSLHIDTTADKFGFSRKLSEVGIHSSISGFIGGLVKWFLILVFLMAATDILGLGQVSEFLKEIIGYVPNVIVSVVILASVFLLGNFVYNIVKGSTRAAGVMSATLLATISKWSIIVFGIFAALIQLGVASSLISTIFIGLIAMISLAGGLAFGLGGREEAQLILRKLREELTEEHRDK